MVVPIKPSPIVPKLSIRLFRSFAIPLFRSLYNVLSRPHVEGYENIPDSGPYLITVNHLSYYDPPLAISFWPHPTEVLGAAHQMAKPGIGHIMRWYGTHPVRRDSLTSDLPVLRLALALLRAGHPLLIMPEGRRNPAGLGKAHLGAAYLAAKAHVPIVPVAITGTEKMFPSLFTGRREELHMVIGPCYHLPTLQAMHRKQELRTWTDIIMNRIAVRLPQAYRGIYGDA